LTGCFAPVSRRGQIRPTHETHTIGHTIECPTSRSPVGLRRIRSGSHGNVRRVAEAVSPGVWAHAGSAGRACQPEQPSNQRSRTRGQTGTARDNRTPPDTGARTRLDNRRPVHGGSRSASDCSISCIAGQSADRTYELCRPRARTRSNQTRTRSCATCHAGRNGWRGKNASGAGGCWNDGEELCRRCLACRAGKPC
jgi:hypothetical protein